MTDGPHLTDVRGIGEATAQALVQAGISSVDALARASTRVLQSVPGFGASRAATIRAAARALLGAQAGEPGEGRKKKKEKKKKKKKGRKKKDKKDQKKKKKKKKKRTQKDRRGKKDRKDKKKDKKRKKDGPKKRS